MKVSVEGIPQGGPRMQEEERKSIRSRWKNAVRMVCTGAP